MIQVETARATPTSDERTSIILTDVLVYYKDCCRISKKATESVKTLRITVDFYILYLCNKKPQPHYTNAMTGRPTINTAWNESNNLQPKYWYIK